MAHPAANANLHARCGPDARAGHRSQHRHLQRRERRAPPPPALPRLGPSRTGDGAERPLPEDESGVAQLRGLETAGAKPGRARGLQRRAHHGAGARACAQDPGRPRKPGVLPNAPSESHAGPNVQPGGACAGGDTDGADQPSLLAGRARRRSRSVATTGECRGPHVSDRGRHATDVRFPRRGTVVVSDRASDLGRREPHGSQLFCPRSTP